jgi:hypothetical protein
VIEHLAIEAVERITFGESFVNQEVVIIGVSPLEPFLGDHLELLKLLNQPVLDAMHELLNTFLENVKQDIWCYLEAPFFESFGKPEQLLKILTQLMIIVNAVKAKLDI